MSRYDFFGWAPSTPREVKDGIRAQSRSGSFTTSWWGREWLRVLEGFGWDSRLQRGRSYARRGQVTELKLESGRVYGKVQGSDPRPYRVEIRLKPLTDAEWEKAAAELGERPLFLGQLLSGEMPPDIQSVFQTCGASLFPQRARDLEMSCSCPDWAVPCKHLAAVYYLLAEWLDRDPFLLFELRGRDREAFLAALRSHDSGVEPSAAEPDEPLGTEHFWEFSAELPAPRPGPPSPPLGIIRALGDPPGWTGPSLAQRLGPVYGRVRVHASAAAEGTETDQSGRNSA